VTLIVQAEKLVSHFCYLPFLNILLNLTVFCILIAGLMFCRDLSAEPLEVSCAKSLQIGYLFRHPTNIVETLESECVC